MSAFDPAIPGDLAVRLGQEALVISNDGRYVGPNGPVDLQTETWSSRYRTSYYGPGHRHPEGKSGPHATWIDVTNETTLSAHQRHQECGLNPVSLNFASATHPGGGFLRGATAQEEYLCRSSALYLTIKDCPMYALHQSREDHLYTDAMIYSPDVPVFRDDKHELLASFYRASFITSAAPLARLLRDEDFGRLQEVLLARIRKILAVAQVNGHDSIVLGAWGCGAYGNDGNQVADLFHATLNGEFAGAFKAVTFAVVDTSREQRYIGPFARRFTEIVLGHGQNRRELQATDVMVRTNRILRKHINMPPRPYTQLRFESDLGRQFQECYEMIEEIKREFAIARLDEPDASRMASIRQLYAFILERGRAKKPG
jgi:uncharacterized protein (TIGR02452 family)